MQENPLVIYTECCASCSYFVGVFDSYCCKKLRDVRGMGLEVEAIEKIHHGCKTLDRVHSYYSCGNYKPEIRRAVLDVDRRKRIVEDK